MLETNLKKARPQYFSRFGCGLCGIAADSCQQDSTDIQLNTAHLIEMFTALQNVMNSTLTNETRLRILLFKETYGKYEPIFEKLLNF